MTIPLTTSGRGSPASSISTSGGNGARTAGQEPASLDLVLELRAELAAKAVRYCHCRGNDLLARSMDGRNDLDLLVHRRDAQRFLAVIARLGFRRAVAPGGREHPGVGHYYGLERTSGQLVHLRAHFQLQCGDGATRNFRIPIETPFLESVSHHEELPVPAPELELALFVARMMLEHATWDGLVFGDGRLRDRERHELAWLLARADLERCHSVVAEHLAGIGVDLWADCLSCLTTAPSTWRRLLLGRRLRVAIRAHGRRRGAADIALRILRRVQSSWTQGVLRTQTRMRLERTGVTIGIVGPDSSETSTAVEATAAWLGSTFVVHRADLGRPRPSLVTIALEGAMHAARRARRIPGMTGWLEPGTTATGRAPGITAALCGVLAARDRVRLYRAVRQVADAGGIVVAERWPLPAQRVMNGACVGRAPGSGSRSSRVLQWLAATERRLDGTVAAPDVLVVLRTDPELAADVLATDWLLPGAVVVNAGQSAERVLAATRNAIWDRL